MSAVGENTVTRAVGYEYQSGNNSEVSPNLPIRVGIPVEANDAMQEDLDPTTAVQITSVAQAAAVCGWGSPAHQVAKILFPRSGGGLGTIPCFIFPIAKAPGAAPKKVQIACVGTANANGTHYVVIAGRKSVEGESYAINIVKDDTAATVHGKISDVVNNVLGAPMSSTDTDYYAELTSKWSGLTAQGIVVKMNTNGNDLGLSYVVTEEQAGSGTPDIDGIADLIGDQWFTHILNTFGFVSTVMDFLEEFNGKPKTNTTDASGRYSGTIYKPLLAYTGSTAEDPSTTTDARLNNLTIAPAVAPLSDNLPMEVAADWLLLAARCAQDTPHLDITGKALTNIIPPEDGNIGVMSDLAERDRIVKKGCATASIVGGQYIIQDPVTTYHPVGETPPQFRYTRNILIDWNVRFGYMLLEIDNVLDHVIANDDDTVNATKFIKPRIWKGILADYAEKLTGRGLTVDAPFMITNTSVGLSTTNPDRLRSFFKYKRSGYVRQSDTTAEGGFNFGSLSAN